MSFNYTLKYRTLDQLLNEVLVDFQNFNLENMIEPHQMIKVAKRVNYDLGLRIFQTKEAILEVEKGRVKLPDNFYVLNFALLCGNYQVHEPVIQGTQVHERIIPDPNALIPQYQCQPSVVPVCAPDPPPVTPCDPCNKCGSPCCEPGPCPQCAPPCVRLDCKGNEYQLVQVIKTQTRSYDFLYPIKMLQNNETIDCDCPNLYWDAPNTGWIRDGFLYVNFEHGKVYLNYQGTLEDDQGNVLVPDHDLLNEYYEYAFKQRILENLMMNDENVTTKLQLIEVRYRAARDQALGLVNMPNFAEMKKMWEVNRKAQYSKYYNMFKSYAPGTKGWFTRPWLSAFQNTSPTIP
jgi:hypothetical protein